MTEKLTAEKARDLSRASDPAGVVGSILQGVEQAAASGKWEYITREHGFGSGECYGNEGKWPKLCQAVVKELRSLGYSAVVRVQDGSQFCDLWLQVTWR